MNHVFRFTFTLTYLADAFIQSDLHCIQVTVLHFISSDQVDGQIHVHPEEMAAGCTMGRKQSGRGSVMLWAMFSWEVDVTLTHTTYLKIVADHIHPFQWCSLSAG